METWKPGKRFPRFQVSRVPGFLGFQISRFPRFPGFSSDLRSNPDPSDLDLAPARPGVLETWKKVSRFRGACGCSWAGNPTRDPPLQALFCRGGQPATQLFKKTKRTCAGTRHQTQTANPIGALSGSRTTYVLPSAWSGARTEGGLSRFPTMPPAWGA